ncbi:MAG TPA: hypothetical protein VK960_10860 [Acidimicrobiia bacterium]|nr:hypothetical protein [Acidimicrobiia bacterium]
MPAAVRVLVDLSPVLLGTALARVLTGLGYEVDVGDPQRDYEVAVVSQRNGLQVPIVIELPPPEKTTAKVYSRGGQRRVPVRDLRALLDVLDYELGRQPLAFEG